MFNVTDYEKVYCHDRAACGAPMAEFTEFFEGLPGPACVLDVGCGQGRDALVAARLGHEVHGIDRAGTGVRQMVAQARKERLAVTGRVADMESWEPGNRYHVVVLDRVLHMLPNNARRSRLLERAGSWVLVGGHLLIADTATNRRLIHAEVAPPRWEPILTRKDVLFARRIEPDD